MLNFCVGATTLNFLCVCTSTPRICAKWSLHTYVVSSCRVCAIHRASRTPLMKGARWMTRNKFFELAQPLKATHTHCTHTHNVRPMRASNRLLKLNPNSDYLQWPAITTVVVTAGTSHHHHQGEKRSKPRQRRCPHTVMTVPATDTASHWGP